MPALNRLPATRIVATPSALDAAAWPANILALRIASDEVLVTPPAPEIKLNDPHAIFEPDSGFADVWLAADEALKFLERECEWELPAERPAFAQGMVAGIAAKLWLESDRVLIIVPAPFVADFEERMT
ncbi:MAG: hypothetical protein HYZ49_16250 [Chloroflexi bacterium]|nr:hypothetical protein [Chloroflexota bacterium]